MCSATPTVSTPRTPRSRNLTFSAPSSPPGGHARPRGRVYGNAVNATKRIRALAGEVSEDRESNTIAVGVIDSELGEWFKREFDFKSVGS